VPNLSIASDFIVGFCGETEEDHRASLRLIERCRFKNLFVFKYSERPGTTAAKRMDDDVPEEVKRRRNHELLDLQLGISLAANRQLVGRTVEVLVEGYSKAAVKAQEAEQTRGHEVSWRRSDQLVGRTRGDQIVVFPGGPELIGTFARIRITAATGLTLHGVVVNSSTESGDHRSAESRPLTVLRSA
jgi:tRNA-2-methylthio-N6-dimethylallyladenosine synthase